MTQEDLVNSLFVDRATVSKWETGNYIANLEILLQLRNLVKFYFLHKKYWIIIKSMIPLICKIDEWMIHYDTL